MWIDDVSASLGEKLAAQTVPSRVLLDRLRLIDETSRKSGQYQDPNYLPFYYHLSKFVSPKSILHVGFDLALPSCCFLMGCPSAERLLGFQRSSAGYYSPRIALSNIRSVKGRKFSLDFHMGGIIDAEFEQKLSPGFDMVMITERRSGDQLVETLEVCWDRLPIDGVLVVDHISSDHADDIFSSFCRGRSRPHSVLATRYGMGIVQK